MVNLFTQLRKTEDERQRSEDEMAQGSYRYVKAPQKTTAGGQRQWAQSIKDRAVEKYVITGSRSITARELNIPIDTLNGWMKKDWFKDAIATKRNEQIELLDSKLTELSLIHI